MGRELGSCLLESEFIVIFMDLVNVLVRVGRARNGLIVMGSRVLCLGIFCVNQ